MIMKDKIVSITTLNEELYGLGVWGNLYKMVDNIEFEEVDSSSSGGSGNNSKIVGKKWELLIEDEL